MLDFSAWTGWIIINEFDVFLAITLAVTLLRLPARPHRPLLDRPARFALALVAISFVVSAAIGLVPLSPLDGNALPSDTAAWLRR